MARQETILTVFVASPSDLDEERNRLEEVIRDLNTTWARELTIRLDLVRWETHAYPSFGDDAQAVINEQLPDDYDLFIGLMWYRFGTPTARAGSGTLEEFQRTKERFDRDPSALQLMVYFKDAPAPVSPSKLDHEQLAKVSQFRDSLGEEGALYWSFTSVDDFERKVRLHLTRHVQAWRSKHDVKPDRGAAAGATARTGHSGYVEQDDEPGLLDLMEQFEDEFATLVEITERIAAATVEIGEKMQARTTETKEFTAGSDASNRKAAKRLISKAAADMDQYVHRMEAELPLFSQHLNSGMNALISAAAMGIEFKIEGDDLEQVKDNLDFVREFRETITTVEGQIGEFQEAVRFLPRMTTTLNRAKRALVSVLQQLIDELSAARNMAKEAEASFSLILDEDCKR
jgi:hypothetical protein